MAKTQDLRRRIRSIRNTMQLTKAMKTVSAAKLRRAQDSILRARPYADQMARVLKSLASRANPEAHPLLRVREETGRAVVIVVTSDRGLCGSFNVNLCRTALGFVRDQAGRDLEVVAIGRKGRDYFRRRQVPIGHEWLDVFRTLDYARAAEIAGYLMGRYVDEQIDAVYAVYNEFKSTIQQRPVVEQILPVERLDLEPGESEDYIYEPDAASLFDGLMPKYVEVEVFRALLESVAAEHAARMTAMDSATRNAGELIDKLTLHMNRVRQASITTEIIEVVSGAQALG